VVPGDNEYNGKLKSPNLFLTRLFLNSHTSSSAVHGRMIWILLSGLKEYPLNYETRYWDSSFSERVAAGPDHARRELFVLSVMNILVSELT
jgi:hypothetical protein